MSEETKQRRLCSEIQLFDLCDLDACKHKDGRYCTKSDILAKFEAIKDEDPEQYLAEDPDEAGDGDPDDESCDEAGEYEDYEDEEE